VQLSHVQEKRWKDMGAAAKAVVILLERNLGGFVAMERNLRRERLIVPGVGRRWCGVRHTQLRRREIHHCPQEKEYSDEAIQSLPRPILSPLPLIKRHSKSTIC
jgi:hypothetical protein